MLHQTKDAFKVPEGFDFEEFLRPSFGVFQGEPVKGQKSPTAGLPETVLSFTTSGTPSTPI
jgi:hypothetical protein